MSYMKTEILCSYMKTEILCSYMTVTDYMWFICDPMIPRSPFYKNNRNETNYDFYDPCTLVVCSTNNKQQLYLEKNKQKACYSNPVKKKNRDRVKKNRNPMKKMWQKWHGNGYRFRVRREEEIGV